MGALADAGAVAGDVAVAAASGDIALGIADPGDGAGDVGDITSMYHHSPIYVWVIHYILVPGGGGLRARPTHPPAPARNNTKNQFPFSRIDPGTRFPLRCSPI